MCWIRVLRMLGILIAVHKTEGDAIVNTLPSRGGKIKAHRVDMHNRAECCWNWA
jgi:hypothetical protein